MFDKYIGDVVVVMFGVLVEFVDYVYCVCVVS